jgi:hypothetical protein
MDTRPVFVLITAKTCPGCLAFKRNTWDNLKEQLENEGKVQIVTVEVPTTMSKPDPEKYHKDLPRFIGWFPTMILFPANRWNNHNSELIGIVKNGRLLPPGTNENGNFFPEHVEMVGKIDLSKEDILNWVNYTITKDKMFIRNEPVNAAANNSNKNVNTDQVEIINTQNSNGKFIVLTAGSYAKFHKFQPSKVE